MKNDLILAVQRKDLGDHPPTGFYSVSDTDVIKSLDSLPVWFGPRDHLENDETFVQLIPYIILTQRDKVVRYRRASKIREGRLAGKRSIGFGGHIELQDLDSDEDWITNVEGTVRTCAKREVKEEVSGLVNQSSLTWRGFVHYDTNTLGRVHLGVVGTIEVTGRLAPKESAITELEMVTLEALEEDQELETWSKMVLPVLRDYRA